MRMIQAGSIMAPRHHKAAPCEGLHSQRTWLNKLAACAVDAKWHTNHGGCWMSYMYMTIVAQTCYRQIVRNISQYIYTYAESLKKEREIVSFWRRSLSVHCFIGCGGAAALNYFLESQWGHICMVQFITSAIHWLVVSTPLKKYWSNWESSPNRGENEKYLKPPPSYYMSVTSNLKYVHVDKSTGFVITTSSFKSSSLQASQTSLCTCWHVKSTCPMLANPQNDPNSPKTLPFFWAVRSSSWPAASPFPSLAVGKTTLTCLVKRVRVWLFHFNLKKVLETIKKCANRKSHWCHRVFTKHRVIVMRGSFPGKCRCVGECFPSFDA